MGMAVDERRHYDIAVHVYFLCVGKMMILRLCARLYNIRAAECYVAVRKIVHAAVHAQQSGVP